ncbi:unnamed protein product (macronuclear) [Paramecium tetraurelia]|uniref:Uncharacterized protein n=1 Tax=Paramecium tetraurelia TaxID=5888 RepID=A0BHE0_PARTE|nr:uncharacterized protein GSPATT00028992001 [Paramecium tetraurelia]CAK57957.1 unnamed protein product [Paramecium tetraurelia]|eukprot:XP_001425355.1 hypothetical protein (macronuclear) [Paramecium tetraurelia strain d4-2]
MKYLLIPATIYFLVTGWYLFIEAKLPYYPFQHLLEFTPNHAIQALFAVALGLCIVIDNQKLLMAFLFIGVADLSLNVRQCFKLEMQELSEALQHVGYKTVILGIIIEAMRKQIIYEEPEKKKKKKKKVKKMVEVEVEEEVDDEQDEAVETRKLNPQQPEEPVTAPSKKKEKKSKK